MTMRRLLLGTAAAAGLVVVAAASEPAFISPIGQAQAAVSASISIGVFYDRLSGYGDWVSFRDDYVWVPRVDVSWRPYAHGHWIYVNTYGWYWASEEPFAWAVYHYGRWGFDPEIGWYWVPGRRWAPAWVVWSHTDDDIAWAPLPPDYDDDDIDVAITISSVPVYYWNVVPINVFVSVDIDRHIIHDRDRIRHIVEAGDTKTVVVQNNVVVNNFIDVDVIEQKTKQDVVVYEPKPADSPEAAGKAEGQAIAVFDAEVKEEPGAKPAKAKKAEEIAKEKKSTGMVPQEPASGTASEAPAAEPEGQAVQGDQPAAEPQGQAVQGEQPVKKKVQGTTEEQPAVQPEGQAVHGEQPVKMKVQETTEEQPAVQPEGQAVQGEQPVKKKKAQEATEEQPASTEKALEAAPEAAPEGQAEEQPQKKEKQKACDPAKEECAAE
jgi:hypothetical protein